MEGYIKNLVKFLFLLFIFKTLIYKDFINFLPKIQTKMTLE